MAANCVNLAIENAMQMLKAIYKYDKKESDISSSTSTPIAIPDFTNGSSSEKERSDNEINHTINNVRKPTSQDQNSQIHKNQNKLDENFTDQMVSKNKSIYSESIECQNRTDLYSQEESPNDKKKSKNRKNNKGAIDKKENINKKSKLTIRSKKKQKGKQNNEIKQANEKTVTTNSLDCEPQIDINKEICIESEGKGDEPSDDWDSNWTEDGECINEEMKKEVSLFL